MYYLGIDAGGTKCKARITDASGCILGEGLSGPANLRIGAAKVFSVIMQAANQAILAANLTPDQVSRTRAGMGVAGVDRLGAKEELQSQPFPFDRTLIHNDAFVTNFGAHSGGDGGTVIVGTGSIGVGRKNNLDIRIGGYGFPISDEGSGAYMGLQAIRITMRASDRRLRHSDMTRTLFQKFGSQTHSIVKWMDQASATDYAALAPTVVQAADAGDQHGRLILQDCANHIDMIIRALYRHGISRCCVLGGLSEKIEAWLAPDIRAQLAKPDGDALDGALYLARTQNCG